MLSLAVVTATVMTQEPEGPFVALMIAAATLAVWAAATLTLLRLAGSERRARAARGAALRRGGEISLALALLAGLQVIGGLTWLTAFLVLLSFGLAEYVLSAGRSSRIGGR